MRQMLHIYLDHPWRGKTIAVPAAGGVVDMTGYFRYSVSLVEFDEGGCPVSCKMLVPPQRIGVNRFVHFAFDGERVELKKRGPVV